MTIIACKECSRAVSDKAIKCPHCGFILRKLKRGVIGKLIKLLFILFNLFMIIWLFSSLIDIREMSNLAMSDLEKAGVGFGATLGIGLLLVFWAIGDVILGALVLFTRPSR